MKIVCDACQAKYSISDDKVQGKVFKIRCKKCSNIIVVRGGGGGAAEAAAPAAGEKEPRVYDYGHEGGEAAPAADDAVWHVVINQDQVGPMTAVEVEQKFASGEIDADTYACREGFADWLPLSQVDAFASLVSSGSTTTASDGGGASAVSSMFGGGEQAGTVRSDPGDLFATASKSAAATASDDDGDNRQVKKVRIWSARCSSGEEPYTIAMLLTERGYYERAAFAIFASDINQQVLSKARKGHYRENAFRATTPELREKYFAKEADGSSRVLDTIKNKVSFGRLNLYDASRVALLGYLDIIFCRNVIIYFDDASKKMVVSNFYGRLNQGGYLLLAHSESLISLSSQFKLKHLRSDMVYQK